LTILIAALQLLLEFQGLAQESEGDNAVLSQRLKSLANELQSMIEKQLQVRLSITVFSNRLKTISLFNSCGVCDSQQRLF